MMSKTHLTVGVATSLAICQPATVGTLMTAIAGGAAGSILCDIECKGHPGMWDAAIGRIIAIGISLTALFRRGFACAAHYSTDPDAQLFFVNFWCNRLTRDLHSWSPFTTSYFHSFITLCAANQSWIWMHFFRFISACICSRYLPLSHRHIQQEACPVALPFLSTGHLL